MIRLLLLCVVLSGCGYHVAGRADLLPKDLKTIAIPAFNNNTVRTKLGRLVTADLAREFNSRTRYRIVADPREADAVLTGTILRFDSYPVVVDPVSNRATGLQAVVALQLALNDRRTGKALYTQSAYEFRDRYEISVDPQAYFEESGTAIERMSRDIARSVVSA